MFRRKFLPVLVVLGWIGSFNPLFSFEIDFSNCAYDESGLPSGWMLTEHTTANATLFAVQPSSPTDSLQSGLTVDFESASMENLLKSTNKIDDDLICDTLLAELSFYAQPEADIADKLQVVVSTNNWDSYESLGEAFEIEEAGRAHGEWVTYRRILRLDGLSSRAPDIYVGILLIPGGWSGCKGWIRSLKVGVAASAAPTNVGLKSTGGELLPGDQNISMSANVTPDPNDERFQLEGVYGIITRNTAPPETNRLFNVVGTDEYTNVVLRGALDAGETIEVSAFSKYKAIGISAAGIVNANDSYVYEDALVPGRYKVGKLGSVWINELSSSKIELCGSINREMLSGWSLVVTNMSRGVVCMANLGDAFNFVTNKVNNVIGIDVRELEWVEGSVPTDSDTYYVLLCNSRMIVEHAVSMVFSDGAVRGMVGCAKWPDQGEEYDWTGTADDGTFTWDELSNSNFGEVNFNQGFNVPVSIDLTIKSTIGADDGADLISGATVVATITNFSNASSFGIITNYTEISVDGEARFVREGWTPYTNDIHAVISGSAFGWISEEKSVVLTNGCPALESLAFNPTVALDDFSSFATYWHNTSEYDKWKVGGWEYYDQARTVLFLDTSWASEGQYYLECGNYLSSHGKKECSVEFDYCNTLDIYEDWYDEFSVLISTNVDFNGEIVSTPAVLNKREGYADKEWYCCRAVFEMPDGFRDAPEIWLKLSCVSKGYTGTGVYIDNLRIAFQDVAMPTNLTRAVATPVSGQSSAFALDVVPQTSDEVGEVSADLHLVLNGETNLVHFAFPNDGVYTNGLALTGGEEVAKTLTISADELSRQLGEAYGVGERPFLLGDTVTCFAAVRYNSDNGATADDELYETRYYPDDSVVSNIDDRAYWICEATTGYGPAANLLNMSAYNFTVTDGDAISKYGDVEATTGGVSFKLHAYDASGLGSLAVTINGVTYSVADDDGTHFPNFADVDFSTENPVRLTGVFQLASGLLANTQYTVTISGTRANGSALDSALFSFMTMAKGATKAPAAEKIVDFDGNVAKVSVSAPANYDPEADDDNSASTEYAVVVATSSGVTNRVSDAQDAVIWKTIADWKTTPIDVLSPTIDLAATNYFHFIARNSSGVEAVSGELVQSSVVFDMESAFVAATQVADPFGYVTYSINFMDAAQGENSEAAVEYKLDNGEWTTITNALAISFASGMKTSSGPLSWDAKSALGANYSGDHVFTIRAKVASGERVSEWATIEGALDFTKPSGLEFTEQPSAYENTASFSFTATATDDKAIAYWWSLNNAEPASGETTYDGSAVENQTNTVSVYAVDAMSNASDPIEYSWVVDVEKPSTPVVTDENSNGTYTKNVAFSFAATATDNLSGVDHYLWQHNNGAVTQKSSGVAFAGDATEGSNTITVKAVDKAGNVSDASSFSWIYDKTAPSAPAISGEPAASAKTASGSVSLTASATDNLTDATNLVYTWTLTRDGNPVLTDVTGVEFARLLAEDGSMDGVYSASVVATDKAGNVGEASTRTWTLDTTKPTGLEIAGTPSDGALTNGVAFCLTASATDATALTYYWSLNHAPAEERAAGVQFTGSGVEGDNIVSVYAVDEAGNQCDAVSTSWKLDVTKPTVSLSTATVSPFKDDTFTVTATFSEKVTGFVKGSVSVTNGSVDGTPSASDDGKVYTFVVRPAAEDVVTVAIASDKVQDEAGNGNEASTNALSLRYDITRPSASLTCARENRYVNAEAMPLEMALEFSEGIASFAAGDLTVSNCGISDFAGNGTNYTFKVTALADGEEFSVRLEAGKVADPAGNLNTASDVVAYVYDNTKPATPTITGTPGNGSITNLVDYSLTAESSDTVTEASKLVYRWTFEGEESTCASISGTLQENKLYTASVYAIDEAGNESVTNVYEWVLDTQMPTNLVVEGTSGVVATKDFGFTASAEDATAITFHWEMTGGTGAASGMDDSVFSGEGTAAEGTNTVSVHAEDAAGNRCDPVERKWVVDTISPVMGEFVLNPDALTKVPEFTIVASAVDATRLTYHWEIVRGGTGAADPSDSARFSGVAAEGTNTVSVYATDEAGNVSTTTNTWEWVLDMTAPAKLNMAGTSGVVGTTNFAFTASAEDESMPITYRWALNGIEANEKGATFNGCVAEGTNTVSVSAIDAAGNECGAEERKWVADVTSPVIHAVTGLPYPITRVQSFTLAAEATDNLTEISYFWSFNGAPFEEGASTRLVETADDGGYSVEVYVEDEAGNVSATNTVSWTLDTKIPEGLKIDGAPAAGAVTKSVGFDFTASASDDSLPIAYCWSLNGNPVDCNSSNYVGVAAANATNTVSVYAVDAAGNQCDPVSLTWVVDTEPPADLAIDGAPVEGAATNDTAFAFTASASDDSLPIAYCWSLNGNPVDCNSSNYVGVAVANATNTVSVYAVDAAGNSCDPIVRTWVVDTAPPSKPEFTKRPDPLTNESVYSFAVSSTDELTGVAAYYWSFDGNEFESGTETLDGSVSEGRDYEVLVYAVDTAGNSSATNSCIWTFDATKPTVTLTSDTPDPFNANYTFTVKVEFSEKVVGFAADKIAVVNGTVKDVEESQDPATTGKVFMVTFDPDNEDVTLISVQVEANQVTDLAGNRNEASNELTWHCILKRPTVALSSDADPVLKTSFDVTVVFSVPVTNFSASSVYVDNGSIGSISNWTGSASNYTVTVQPSEDGDVIVQIRENVVADEAGNGNRASEELRRIYDTTPPRKPVISGIPANGTSTSSSAFNLSANPPSGFDSLDENGISYYIWTIRNSSNPTGKVKITYTNTFSGEAAEGSNVVWVIAVDVVKNASIASDSWVFTYEPASGDIDFGDGVTLPVNPDTGATNSVEFVTIDFKPGSKSSFTLSGFETDKDKSVITGLKMWFVVCDTLSGTPWQPWHVPVDENATYDAEKKVLTVSLPSDATKKDGKQLSSFFIFGIDNKGE